MPNGVTLRSRKSGGPVYQAWVWIPGRGGLTQTKLSRTFDSETDAVTWREAEMQPVYALLRQEQAEKAEARRQAKLRAERARQETIGAVLAAEAEFRNQRPPSLKNEVWKEVPGWEGLYEVSTLGRVWSRPRKRVPGGIMKPTARAKGYLMVTLWNTRRYHQDMKVHHLVLFTFVSPRPPNLMCRHLNGNAHDNRLMNLRWGTAKENAEDRVRHEQERKAKK